MLCAIGCSIIFPSCVLTGCIGATQKPSIHILQSYNWTQMCCESNRVDLKYIFGKLAKRRSSQTSISEEKHRFLDKILVYFSNTKVDIATKYL